MMQKLVNGRLVDMTLEEIAEREAAEAAWASRHIPTDDEIDQSELNRALVADGSVLRAIAEIQFGMIKGTIPVTPSLTKLQYVAMLKAKMRTT